jgi:hypothetical protein
MACRDGTGDDGRERATVAACGSSPASRSAAMTVRMTAGWRSWSSISARAASLAATAVWRASRTSRHEGRLVQDHHRPTRRMTIRSRQHGHPAHWDRRPERRVGARLSMGLRVVDWITISGYGQTVSRADCMFMHRRAWGERPVPPHTGCRPGRRFFGEIKIGAFPRKRTHMPLRARYG